MNSSSTRRQEAIVGLFVLIAAALLIITVFSLTGFSIAVMFVSRVFKNAGGLRPGSEVRYAGGPPIGRIEDVRCDQHDTTRMEIVFSRQAGHSGKKRTASSSSAAIARSATIFWALFLAARLRNARRGFHLKFQSVLGFGDLEAELGDLAPQARVLLDNLNQRVVELQTTIARVNDVLNDKNRANLSASLGTVRRACLTKIASRFTQPSRISMMPARASHLCWMT